MRALVRKSLVEGPVLALAGYVVVVGAVLAGPRAGSLVLAGYLLAVAVLAMGVGEGLVVRGLWWCRPASVTDRRVLVGALEHLDPGVRVYVAARHGGVDAVPVGRRALVVTRGLVDGLAARRLPLNVAVALIVGARGQRDAGVCRRDPALRVAQLPAVPLLILGAAAARSRLLRAAWPFRGVFAVIAAIQTTQDGIAWVGALVLALLGFTYAYPRWRRGWTGHAIAVFDAAVQDAGRGPDLATWLDTVAGTDRDRIVRLRNPDLTRAPT